MNDRQSEVNALLVKLEPQFEVGHVERLTFDFVDFKPGDTRPVVDANGEFILLCEVNLKFLCYEKSLVEDVIKGLRDTAAQLKRVEFDMTVTPAELAAERGAA
jgi:hypothetical protein